MAYAQVSYGSTGSSVSALQEKLNANGYDLEVDGEFGPATQKAVKDYQKKKGLQVDGIAGAETWGSLLQSPAAQSGPTTGKQVLSGVSDETADRLAWLEQGYAPSDEVDAALAEWESVAAARPGAYQSSFEEELQRLYEEIAARPGFDYDPAKDAAYHSYAALYEKAGSRAMADTLGKAAALTGGYGSTYAMRTRARRCSSAMKTSRPARRRRRRPGSRPMRTGSSRPRRLRAATTRPMRGTTTPTRPCWATLPTRPPRSKRPVTAPPSTAARPSLTPGRSRSPSAPPPPTVSTGPCETIWPPVTSPRPGRLPSSTPRA